MATQLVVPESSEVLHERLVRLRDDPRTTNAQYVNAFEAWFRQACVEERPPDALRLYIRDEAERFKQYLIPGADGHCYWIGAKSFTRNDGKNRRPIRWMWEYHHGEIGPRVSVWPVCGEPHCVAINHLESGLLTGTDRVFSNETIIGAAKVFYLRYGHSPSRREWRKHGLRPNPSVVIYRFGSWLSFLEKAGLPAREPIKNYSDEHILNGIKDLGSYLGKDPTAQDWIDNREWLRANNLPTSLNTVKRRFGTWGNAAQQAGYVLSHSGHRFTEQELMDCLRGLAQLAGRSPTRDDFTTHREWLKEHRYPLTAKSFRDHFGSWTQAKRLAGV